MVSSNFARQLNGESRSDLGTPRLGSGGRAFLGVVSCVAVMLSATAFISARAVLSARRLPAVSLLNDVAVVEVRMPTWRFSSRESRAQLASEIDGAVVSAVNGDTRVGFASSTPPDVGVLAAAVSLEGMEIGRESHSALGAVSIAGRYFDALGIRALAGRFPAKGEKSAVVVSESVARMFGRRPSELVGRRLQVGPEFWAIVGVVADVVLPGMTSALGGRVVYFPLVAGRANVSLLVRPASSAQAVKVALSNIDPDLAVSAASLPDRIMTNVKPLISMAVGFVAAAIAAMTLAVAGAYAVCASFVEHNRREIGIRIALGARSRDMASWLIRLTFVYCFLGALAGGVLPFAVGRWWAQSEQVLGGAEPAVRLGAVLSVTVVLAIAALWPLVRYRRAEPADVLT
jgi:ABC-type antimicrobial peptide transport system permease subunit